jgi:hypothetical protein
MGMQPPRNVLPRSLVLAHVILAELGVLWPAFRHGSHVRNLSPATWWTVNLPEVAYLV